MGACTATPSGVDPPSKMHMRRAFRLQKRLERIGGSWSTCRVMRLDNPSQTACDVDWAGPGFYFLRPGCLAYEMLAPRIARAHREVTRLQRENGYRRIPGPAAEEAKELFHEVGKAVLPELIRGLFRAVLGGGR